MGIVEIVVFCVSFCVCAFLIGFLLNNRKKVKESIVLGQADAEIVYDDHVNRLKDKKHRGLKIAFNVTVDVILTVLGAILVLGLCDTFLNINASPYKSIVVATGSMSNKNEANDYLNEEKLDNQIQVNDLIFVKKVDNIEEIKKYDVICYVNSLDLQIVHRVVEVHDGYVKTRGDAVDKTDEDNITIDKIVGKYTDVRIPHVGNFVFFVSSTYGLITIFSCFSLLLAYWIIKDNISKYEKKRLSYLLGLINDSTNFEIDSGEGLLVVNNDSYNFKMIEESERVKKETVLKIDSKSLTLTSTGVKENEKETN